MNRCISLIFAPDWTIQEIIIQAETDQEESHLRVLVDRILKNLGEVENESIS